MKYRRTGYIRRNKLERRYYVRRSNANEKRGSGMRVAIYLNERKEQNLLVNIQLDNIVQAIYEIDGKLYCPMGFPRFIIAKDNGRDTAQLAQVEIVVQSYHDNDLI